MGDPASAEARRQCLPCRSRRQGSTAVSWRFCAQTDAAESALSGCLSMIALAGLVANAFQGITWADPVVALCLMPRVAREGLQTLKGRPRDCCWQYPTEVISMTAIDPNLRFSFRILLGE